MALDRGQPGGASFAGCFTRKEESWSKRGSWKVYLALCGREGDGSPREKREGLGGRRSVRMTPRS